MDERHFIFCLWCLQLNGMNIEFSIFRSHTHTLICPLFSSPFVLHFQFLLHLFPSAHYSSPSGSTYHLCFYTTSSIWFHLPITSPHLVSPTRLQPTPYILFCTVLLLTFIITWYFNKRLIIAHINTKVPQLYPIIHRAWPLLIPENHRGGWRESAATDPRQEAVRRQDDGSQSDLD